MDRHTMVMVTLSLLLSAALLLLPVNAKDDAGPDTSGFDLDLGGIVTGLLDNDISVVLSPPRWQWDAERYMDEGHKCAAKCELQKQDYLQRAMASQVKPGTFTADEIEKLKNLKPQSPSFWEGGAIDTNKWKELGVTSSYNKIFTYCDCAQKNYNKAYQLTKDDNYQQQAEIFDAGTGLYNTLGKTEEAQQTRDAAAVARAHAAASGFFLPLSPWVVIAGLIGAFLLMSGKRK